MRGGHWSCQSSREAAQEMEMRGWSRGEPGLLTTELEAKHSTWVSFWVTVSFTSVGWRQRENLYYYFTCKDSLNMLSLGCPLDSQIPKLYISLGQELRRFGAGCQIVAIPHKDSWYSHWGVALDHLKANKQISNLTKSKADWNKYTKYYQGSGVSMQVEMYPETLFTVLWIPKDMHCSLLPRSFNWS